MESPKTFPIMAVGGCHAFDLPWTLIAPHEAQAVANHGQTLARLAERGGLSATEAYAVMNGLSLRESLRRKNDAAYAWEWLRSRAEDAEISKLRAELDAARAEAAKWLSRFQTLVDASVVEDGGIVALQREIAAAREESAKLREERRIHIESIVEHSRQLSSARSALSAARAALDGEREACDEAEDHLRQCFVHHMNGDENEDAVRAWRDARFARRAAEATQARPETGVTRTDPVTGETVCRAAEAQPKE